MGDQAQPVDETANFVTVSTDYPTQSEPQAEPKDDGEASQQPENGAGEEGKEPQGDEPKGDVETDTGKETAAERGQESDKGKGGVQKRFNTLTRQREEQRLRAEAAERRIAELEAAAEKSKKEEPEAKEPKEEDFQTYEEYLDASEAYAANEKNKGKPDQQEPEQKPEDKKPEEQKPEGLTDSQQVAMAVLKDVIDRNEALPEDFEAVALAQDVPINGSMLEALAECDDPAKVMYHLGKNKELSAEIAGKTPVQQAREIAKLDMTVTAKKPKPANVTNAPETIDPVGGGDTQQKSVADMSFSEYEAYMNKKERGG